VFVELPGPGATLTQFEKMGEIESVKAVSDLFSPIGGQVIESNKEAIDSPELVNESPYESGWLVRVVPADAAELDNLMTAAEYEALLAAEAS
jgi:glycine cleavage system H protein